MTTTAQYAQARQAFHNAEAVYVKLVSRCVECEWDRTPELKPSDEAINAAKARAEHTATELRKIASTLTLEAQKNAEHTLGKNGF